MCRSLFFTLLFSFVLISVLPQNNNLAQGVDPIFEELVEKAQLFAKNEQYDSALIYFNKSISILKNLESHPKVSYLEAQIGEIWIYKKEYDKAELISKSALKKTTPSQEGKILANENLGVIADYRDGDYKKALEYHHKAFAISADYLKSASELSNDLHRRSLRTLGYLHRDNRVFDSAAYYFEKAIAFTSQQIAIEVDVLAFDELNLVKLDMHQGNFKQARNRLGKIEEMLSSLPPESRTSFNVKVDFFENLSNYYNRMALFDSGLMANQQQELLYRESAHVDSVAFARLLSNIGIAYFNKSEMVKAREYEKRAFEIKKRILNPDDYGMATSYKMMGAHLIRDSHAANEALDYLKEALRITEKNWGENDPRTVDAMQMLAYGYDASQKNVSALELLLKTLKIQLEVEGKYNLATAQLYSQIAGVLGDLGRYDESIEYYKIYDEVSSKITDANMTVPDARAWTNQGRLYLSMANYDLSEKYLRKAEKQFIDLVGDDHPIFADIYNKLSRIYWSRDMLKEAIALNERAIAVNRHGKEVFKNDSLPLIWLAKSKIQFIESHLIRTELLFEQQVMNDSEISWDHFRSTEQLLTDWFKEQNNLSDILSIENFTKNLYASAIHTLWRQDSLNHTQKNAQRMWEFSEKSKALAQKINQHKKQSVGLAAIPRKIIEQENNLNTRIARYKSLVLDEESADSTQARLFGLIQEKKDFLAKVEQDHPKFYELNYAITETHFEDVHQITGASRTIIDYFSWGNALYAFVLNGASISSFQILAPELADDIKAFSGMIRNNKTNEYDQQAFELYKTLFAPLEASIQSSEIVIIPHEFLWNLNFDILLSSQNKPEGSNRPAYLINRYAISYAYATSLLLQSHPSKSFTKQMLAFAFSDGSRQRSVLDNFRNTSAEDLPGTATEVENLSATFSGNFLYGKDATETAFKHLVLNTNYSVLHLALHGLVDDVEFDNSKLFFSSSPADSIEDGYLHPFELYNMDLNANLAVLSACETGAGKITSGEGIMSLGRAFQYAGVNSLLLSQWEVSDPVSPVIMASFYKNLKEGKNKAQALRMAKLDFLETADNVAANPYYWAGFFILGNTDPVEFREQKTFNNYLKLGLLLFIILFWAGRSALRKKRANL